jgi:hypothetical protein
MPALPRDLDPDAAVTYLRTRGTWPLRILPKRHLRPLTLTIIDRLNRGPSTKDNLGHHAKRYLRHSGMPCWAILIIKCLLSQIIDLLIDYATQKP